MATYDLRKKSEVSTGQRKKPFFGQTVSLEAFDELEKKVLKQDKKELELTEKESSILVFLKKSDGPVKINQLQEKVWGYNSELETHTVETHVYRLRKKINDKFSNNEFIIRDKKGYFLNEKKK